MREAPPYAPEPDTLLALVGTSPLPPLHAALEFTPRHLVLAHGSATRWRATRIKKAAEKHGIAEVELRDLGAQVSDFRAVYAGLKPFLEEMQGRPWRLCFTGGTKVMAIEAALAHCEAFPEGHRWRSYLDVSANTLWFSDGQHRAAAVSGGLELEELAELHGADIVKGEPRTAEERELHHVLQRLIGGSQGWDVQRNRWVKDPILGGRKDAGEFDAVLRRGHRTVCVEHKPNARSLLRVAGWTLALAQRVFGAATGVLLVHEGEPDLTLPAQLAEIDPYLNGGKVFGCARTELAGHFPDAEALDKLFFSGGVMGDPDRSPFPPPVPPAEQHPQAGAPVLLALGGSRLGVLASAATHRPESMKLLYSGKSEEELRGIKDAVWRAMIVAEGSEAELERAFNKQGLLRPEYRRKYEPRVKCASAAVSAGHVAAALAAATQALDQDPPDAPAPVADITTGTKAMNLGIALAARARGGCVTYLSPHTRTVHCREHDEHGEVGRAAEAYVDWGRVLGAGYEPSAPGRLRAVDPNEESVRTWLDLELVADAAEAAQRHLHTQGRAPGIWVDKAVLLDSPDDPRRMSAAQRPTVVLTSGDRALGLAAPKQLGKEGRKDWAHKVFAATKVLQKLCGPAGRTQALIRPDPHDPALTAKRARELHRWMAWYGDVDPEQPSEEEHPDERTDHEEMYRPALSPSNPEAPDLSRDVAKELDALLPR